MTRIAATACALGTSWLAILAATPLARPADCDRACQAAGLAGLARHRSHPPAERCGRRCQRAAEQHLRVYAKAYAERQHKLKTIAPYRAWLRRLAWCESRGNPRIVNSLGYAGLYQFGRWAWRAAGGSGRPQDATPLEQSYRAVLLRQRYGLSQWECQVGS